MLSKFWAFQTDRGQSVGRNNMQSTAESMIVSAYVVVASTWVWLLDEGRRWCSADCIDTEVSQCQLRCTDHALNTFMLKRSFVISADVRRRLHLATNGIYLVVHCTGPQKHARRWPVFKLNRYNRKTQDAQRPLNALLSLAFQSSESPLML